MRRVLNVVLILTGLLTRVIAAPSDFYNFVMIEGLYVALPTDMTNFPVELVALP
jgi:hypothetical protein